MGGRPSFGGAGAHQGGAKQGGGIMTLLMPMYTVSIVAFFIYTMLRVSKKKKILLIPCRYRAEVIN